MKTIFITPGQGVGPEILDLALAKIGKIKGVEFQISKRKDPKEALLEVIELAKNNLVDAIVTGPVRKAILQNINGKSYVGQTELLYDYLRVDSKPPLMCFAGGPFLLGLATVHVPIREVADLISADLISHKLDRLIGGASVLRNKKPKELLISVLGLNPHAGENGLLGHEEKEIIEPVIRKYKEQGYQIIGPLAADGFFAYYKSLNFKPDAVLAMMHDQGLGAYKLLCQGKVANLTFGLKILRTSPAHGTADDLVGTSKVNPDSMIKAIELASFSQF